MVKKNNGKCFICESACEVWENITEDYEEDQCLYCGRFIKKIPNGSYEKLKLRQMMYYYLKHRHNNDARTVYFMGDVSSYEKICNVSYQTLMELYPKNFRERIDMILMNLSLSGLTGKFSNPFDTITPDSKNKRLQDLYVIEFLLDIDIDLDCNQDNQKTIAFRSIIEFLKELGYINEVLGISVYSLSAKGWLRIQELESQYKVIPQGFIAMWFDSAVELAGKKIIEAINDSGYNPIKIDLKEHNNQIVPEIFHEIKQSQFVVADLTGHRNGVYYEAGYAKALNKEVIFTCRDDDFDSKHFDVAQQNIIRWTDENDLYNRLINRIQATVGNRNKQ